MKNAELQLTLMGKEPKSRIRKLVKNPHRLKNTSG